MTQPGPPGSGGQDDTVRPGDGTRDEHSWVVEFHSQRPPVQFSPSSPDPSRPSAGPPVWLYDRPGSLAPGGPSGSGGLVSRLGRALRRLFSLNDRNAN